jgi:hypothetical protein
MMATLIITGPPGAGKNTVSEVLARMRDRCAVVDVDYVREMVAQPQHAPWEGDEGKRQVDLGIRHACMLANSFRADGHDVVILDVLDETTIEIYKRLLADRQFKVAMLLPDLVVTKQRNAGREESQRMEDWRVERLHEEQLAFRLYDLLLDNTRLLPQETATKLNGTLMRDME